MHIRETDKQMDKFAGDQYSLIGLLCVLVKIRNLTKTFNTRIYSKH